LKIHSLETCWETWCQFHLLVVPKSPKLGVLFIFEVMFKLPRDEKKHQIQARNVMYVFMGVHFVPFFHHKLQEKSEWEFSKKNALNWCFPFIFGMFMSSKGYFGWMCTSVPRKNIWAEATPQAQETPSGAVQEGNSIPVFDMFQKFLPVFVRSKKGAFLQGFCCKVPWKCDNSWHLSWFLKVDSGVWICQNSSRGFKSCQAKGGLKLAPETFAVCTWKWMDGRLGDY